MNSTRDRDDSVTTYFPILVQAYARVDGHILPPEGLQTQVGILPLAAAEGIFDMKKRRQFRKVFDRVSEDELADLHALALLVAAVGQRRPELARSYTELMAPLETKQVFARLKKELTRWEWGSSVLQKEAEMERARVLRALAERAKFPLHELNWRLNKWLEKVRVVLWLPSRNKRLAPGLYCDSMAAALAALLFSRISSPQAVSICGRCGSPFIRTKRVQRFCSLRCGNADRKARERAKPPRRVKR